MIKSAAEGQMARAQWTARLAAGIGLAASPVFAAMALATAADPGPLALCSAGPGRPPLAGMPAMYALMSLFHLPRWLGLRLARAGAR